MITNLQTGETFELVSIEQMDGYKKITIVVNGVPFGTVESNETFNSVWQ
jgi:hypothetical protein